MFCLGTRGRGAGVDGCVRVEEVSEARQTSSAPDVEGANRVERVVKGGERGGDGVKVYKRAREAHKEG